MIRKAPPFRDGAVYLPPPFTCGSRSATAISPTTCPWMIRSTDSGSPRIVGAGYAPPARGPLGPRRGGVGINLELAAGDVHDPVHRDAAAAIRRGQPAFLGDVPPDDLDDQGDVLGAGMVIAVIADLAAHHGNVRLRLAVPGGDADGVPAPDVPAGGNEACQRIAARFGRERLRRTLSGLLHDSALDQLEAIGLGQDPVLYHLVVLIDGQSFRGRAHDPAPPESTTVAILAAFLAASAAYHSVSSALAVRQVSSDSASLSGSMVNHTFMPR